MNSAEKKAALESFGPAPYRLVGVSTTEDREEANRAQKEAGQVFTANLCGGTCDLCGTAIWNVFTIRCGNGVKVKIGCDCADEVLGRHCHAKAAINRHLNAQRTEKRHAREAARIAAAVTKLAEDPAALTSAPHPQAYRAENGATLRDWADWMMVNSGNAGRVKVARALGC